jgi:hypothetical protein
MSIQPGIGYDIVSTPEGESLVINFPQPSDQVGQPLNLEQFQLVIEGNTLKVVSGTVLWASHNFGASDDSSPSEAKCANQSIVNGYARYTGDSVVIGSNSSSPFMSENGYVTLSP